MNFRRPLISDPAKDSFARGPARHSSLVARHWSLLFSTFYLLLSTSLVAAPKPTPAPTPKPSPTATVSPSPSATVSPAPSATVNPSPSATPPPGQAKKTPPVDGETDWNNSGGTDWNTGTNWTAVSGTAPPAAGDVAWFKTAFSSGQPNLSASTSIAGFYFNGTGTS